jgi:hypothetical protein
MKINGKIELYTDFGSKDQKLVLEDNNLIVDGAGEIIVDMLTTTPSLSGIPSASAVLDTSNYTIQAMTFGKDKEGYKYHAHTDTWSGIDFLLGNNILHGTAAKLSPFSGAMVFVSSNNNPPGGVSSYFPSGAHYNIMPSFPSPLDTKLETRSDTIFSNIETLENIYGPSLPNASKGAFSNAGSRGHNVNVLCNSEEDDGELQSGLTSTGAYLGCLVGAFPRGFDAGGTKGGIFNNVSQLVGDDPVASSVFIGTFNSASSMDINGYVGKVFHPDGVVGSGFTFSNHKQIDQSGIVVSGAGPTQPYTIGEVIYQTVIGKGDLGFTNLYGGIYNIGLWALDTKRTIRNGYSPPFTFDQISNPREYKLFSKKSFTINIAEIADKGGTAPADSGIANYKNLTLIWRLYF